MTKLEHALHLVGQGFWVFPLKPNSKLPAILDFPNKATNNPNKVALWFKDPKTGKSTDNNIAIYTGRFGKLADNKMIIGVDIDVKNGKKGLETILSLEMEGFSLPPTFTQTTPTKGKHYLYACSREERIASGVDVYGDGCDCRADKGYLVAAGSSIEGSYYESNNRPTTEAPQWLLDRSRKRREHGTTAISTVVPGAIDQKQAKLRAIEYLEKRAPLAVEGDGGDELTYKVAAQVKDLGISEMDCLDLMADHWNERCSPPWHPDDLKNKITHAYRYGVNQIGENAPELQFEKVETDGEVSFLESLNKTHALIFIEGDHSILFETTDVKGRPRTVFQKEKTFRIKYGDQFVNHGNKTHTFAQAWLNWPGKRKYTGGITFMPEQQAPEGYYNTWKGFTCKPVKFHEATREAQKGFTMYKELIQTVICDNDAKFASWTMGYWAHMIQRPWERPLTTLVLKGLKGTGKNEFLERVGSLLGSRHYKTAHNSRYLTSNFNGHLDGCLMLVLDEAFWSGDKSAEGVLKGYSTAPEVFIEQKGKEAYILDNLTRIIIIGNEEWLVPASSDERRYAVYNVNNLRRLDRPFFTEMKRLMEKCGGKNVLLQYLKDFDLSTVDVNTAPITTGLLDQKIASTEPFEKWWFDCLTEGRIVGDEFEEGWPDELNKDRFRSAFRRYTKERNINSRLPSDYAVGRLLTKYTGSVNSIQKMENRVRKYVYKFPTIVEARMDYSKHIGHEITWPE